MNNLKFLTVAVALVGCGNVTDPGADDAMPDPDGLDEPAPVDPAVLSIVSSAVRDERGDAIDFSTGEPVHTHAGAPIKLGGSGCPVLYRYAYLLDRAPRYGREAAPNPLAFVIAAPTAIALDASATAYRVMSAAGVELLPWTGFAPDAAGRATIELHRDELAALGAYTGELHLEVRVRDTAGVEQEATACWEHHPMAAPLAIEAPRIATGPAALSGRTLGTPTGSTHVIDLIASGPRPVEVFTQRFVQHTAEPITLEITPAPPTGTFSTTVLDLYVAVSTTYGSADCALYPNICDSSPAPTPPAIVRSGPIVHGTWTTSIVDEVSGAAVSCPAGVCAIPARASGAEPRAYRVLVTGKQFAELWPATVPVGELEIAYHPVTGATPSGPSASASRCTSLQTVFGHDGGLVYTCTASTTYQETLALDRARLDLAPTPFRIAAAISGLVREPVAYLPGGAVASPAVSWDGGDGPM
ncbi:MAG: hypothetical protein IPQ07_36685 [Myxococcales bacterium]|nr:hypothetical protein [Myxococcales bacterium]